MLLQRSPTFKKRFRTSPIKLQDKIAERLLIFVVDEFSPILNNHTLHGEYSDCRSINVTGDVRIVYRRINTELYLLINLGTHNQLYG